MPFLKLLEVDTKHKVNNTEEGQFGNLVACPPPYIIVAIGKVYAPSVRALYGKYKYDIPILLSNPLCYLVFFSEIVLDSFLK